MKREPSLIVILFIAILIGCQKGDPGPTGPAGADGATGATGPTGPAGADPSQAYINGAFAGTVTGTKKDGTALNEAFNYTYSYGLEAFEPSSTSTLNLHRTNKYGDNSSELSLALLITNKGLANQSTALISDSDLNYFSFLKETSPGNLYTLDGHLLLNDFTVVFPIDTLKKSTYPLDFTFNYHVSPGSPASCDVSFHYLTENSAPYYGFSTTNGSIAYFNHPTNGGAFYKIVDAAGNSSNTSATYDGLTLSQDANYNLVFFKGTQDLSFTMLKKADTYSITNYKYDVSAATLSFNFTMKMGGYPFPNATRHPLTITGTFTGKVYNSITNGRVGSN